MTTVLMSLDPKELSSDTAAASGINFCSMWPTAKPILQQLAGVISSTMVKFAINTVISAGDAYCSSGSRLEKFGITLPPSAPAATSQFLSGLSDQELQTLGGIVQQAQKTPVGTDVGTYVF